MLIWIVLLAGSCVAVAHGLVAALVGLRRGSIVVVATTLLVLAVVAVWEGTRGEAPAYVLVVWLTGLWFAFASLGSAGGLGVRAVVRLAIRAARA